MFDGQDGFPFVIGGSTAAVTELHPPGVQVLQLWQIYLENVNPLLKITHTPTIQGQLVEAAANPASISKPLEALMFSIYFIAVTSMTDEEVQDTFKEDRNRLLSKYHHGTQQALINAGFMRSPELVVLQAYVLYLVGDPSNLHHAVWTGFLLTWSVLYPPIHRPALPLLPDRNRGPRSAAPGTPSRCRAVQPAAIRGRAAATTLVAAGVL